MKTKFLQRTIALAAGLAVALVLAEVVLRLVWFGPAGFSPTQLNSFKNAGVSGLLQPTEDSRLLYELKPNLDTLFKFRSFRTNSLGCRDREHQQEKPKNTIRIAVLGDSFAMASCIDEEEGYAHQLELLLNEKSKGQQIEVLNFGTAGYNLHNYQGALEIKALPFDPDVVLVGFCGGNDFERPHPKHYEGNYRVKPVREMFWKSHFWKLLKDLRKPKRVANTTPSPSELAFVDSSFAALKSTCDRHNATLVIAYYSLVATESDVALIAKQADKHQIGFVNASAPLLGGDPRDHFAHPLDPHPDAAAHRIFAEQIHAFLPFHLMLQGP